MANPIGNQITYGGNILPVNASIEVTYNGGTVWQPLTFATVGNVQQGTLSNVPAANYAPGQVGMGAVGYPATRIFNTTVVPVAAAATANVPSITSFSPASGLASSTITITGSGFTGATLVSVNSGAVASFTVNSDTQITAVLTSSQASGTVRVTTPSGTGASATAFTVTAAATARQNTTNALTWDNTKNLTSTLGSFPQFSALSSVDLSTTDTSVTVYCVNEMTSYANLSPLTVLLNGAYFSTLTPVVQTGEQTLTITGLPAGAKDVRIVSGGNTGYNVPNGATRFYGVQITGISFATNGTISPPPTSGTAVWMDGDSISIGDGSTQASRYSWLVVARGLLDSTYHIAAEGWGAKYANGMVTTDADIAAYVARVVAFWSGATRKIYDWNLGTNDAYYAPSPPSASAGVLRKICAGLIAQVPSCEIKVNGLNYRDNQTTANSLGFAAADYSAAYAQVAATPSIATNAKYYDLATVLGTNDMAAGGLHPSNSGHAILGTRKAGIYNGSQAATPVTYIQPAVTAGAPVTFRDVAANVTAGTGTLTVASAGGVFAGIARGTQAIASGVNGFTEFTIPVTPSDVMAGLSTGTAMTGYAGMKYVLYRHANGAISAYESGGEITLPQVTTGTDIFRVAVVGTNVVYSLNGTAIRTVAAPAAQYYPVAALNAVGNQLTNMTIASDAALITY